MFDLFFSFSGRIGRLRYFTTAVGSFVILVAAATLGCISISWKQNPVSGLFALVGIVVLVAIVATWSNLSLQARRIRDIGFDPVLVIPIHLGLHLVLAVAAIRGGHLTNPVASALSLAYSAALLFWPGREDRTPDLEAIFGGVPQPAIDGFVPAAIVHARPAPPPRAPAAPRPGRPSKSFGRRGVA